MTLAHTDRKGADLFAAALRSSLRDSLAVELRGSWNTLEYHLRARNGALESFSDIDCVCDSPSNEILCCIAKIVQTLQESFHPLDLCISLRRRHEVDSLWRGPKSTEHVIDYVNFWTWISILEGFSPDPIDPTTEGLSTYKRCKHILRLWRLVAIVAGYSTRNWGETARFMRMHARRDSVDAVYSVKLGTSEAVNVFSAIEETESALCSYFQIKHEATLHELDRFGVNLCISGTSNLTADSILAETALARALASSVSEPNGSLVLARLQQKLKP